jgi:hypothetical protein
MCGSRAGWRCRRGYGQGRVRAFSDGISRLQIYVRKQDAVAISNDTGEPIDEEGRAWEVFALLDHGDFIGVEGYLFITNTGELSVHVEKLQFLAKAMLPMPDKMHGIADPEIRQRQRYADLIASSLQIEHEGLTTREVFERRAKTDLVDAELSGRARLYRGRDADADAKGDGRRSEAFQDASQRARYRRSLHGSRPSFI